MIAEMAPTSPTPPARGRPTRAQSEALHHALLEAALDHFLTKGFELATMEAIAARAGMTKRTVYARYPDKRALFLAAVHRAIERFTLPLEVIEATDRGDLETTLRAIAWLRVEQVLTPNGLRLQRIINTESYRFPTIFEATFESAALPTVKFLEALFARGTDSGELAIDDPAEAARTFLSMVVGGPVRMIVLGQATGRAAIGRHIEFAVRLFLNGARRR